jgi:hypothetical protein
LAPPRLGYPQSNRQASGSGSCQHSPATRHLLSAGELFAGYRERPSHPTHRVSWLPSGNAMLRHAVWDDPVITDDLRNVVLLRSDIHTLFGARCFVLVPKRVGDGSTTSHAGGPRDELATLHHNVELQPLKEVAVEFLLPRALPGPSLRGAPSSPRAPDPHPAGGGASPDARPDGARDVGRPVPG